MSKGELFRQSVIDRSEAKPLPALIQLPATTWPGDHRVAWNFQVTANIQIKNATWFMLDQLVCPNLYSQLLCSYVQLTPFHLYRYKRMLFEVASRQWPFWCWSSITEHGDCGGTAWIHLYVWFSGFDTAIWRSTMRLIWIKLCELWRESMADCLSTCGRTTFTSFCIPFLHRLHISPVVC